MQTGHTKTNRASAARTALALCASALFLLAFASPAWAVSEHLFEPALSLNGGTTTNFEDEVPDPGTTHPPKTFLFPCGTATDPHGDIYVASSDNGSTAGRIDVFNPQGEYISEIHDEFEPCSLAVDSVGNLYAKEYGPGNEGGKVVLYKPKAYPPSSESGYGPRTVIYNPADHPTGGSGCNKAAAVAVDPSNGHLYIAHGLEKPANCNVEEYGTAAEGSPLIRNDVADNTTSRAVGGIDVYGKNHDVYLTTRNLVGESSLLVLDGADTHKTKCVLDGSETAAGSFSFGLGSSIAVDQANGDFYVWDFGHKIVDQFSVEGSECKFIGSLPKPPTLKGVDPFNDIAVDDPLSGGQPGYESPNAGYAFVISGSTATNSRMFAFKPKTSKFALTVTKPGTGSGTVTSSPAGIDCGKTCTAEFDPGKEVELSQSATPGSEFKEWTGACSGSGSCKVMMSEAKSVGAEFVALAKPQFLLSVAKTGTGSGTVTSSPAGIECGEDCSDVYAEGTKVTLTASPAGGSTFADFSGACSGTGPCEVTMTEAKSVSAEFKVAAKPKFLLKAKVAGSGTGTVTSSPSGINCGLDCEEEYEEGTAVTLTAGAGANTKAATWTGCGSVDGENKCHVSMTSAKEVTATFALEAHLLSVAKTGSGTGTVTSSPAGIACGSECSASFAHGTVLTLAATPAEGSTFAGWSGSGCSGTASCEVAMSEAKSVSAEFTEEAGPVFHTLTITVTGNGSVSANEGQISGCTSAGGSSCEGEYPDGTHVTLTETPGAHSAFNGWQTLQCDESTATTCEVVLSGDEAVAAGFIDTATLTVATEGSGSGTVTSSPGLISCSPFCTDEIAKGAKVTLTATPAPGSTFYSWKGCDKGGVNGRQCTVAMDKAKTVTAVFSSTHALTLAKAGSGSGKVQSSPGGILCLAGCQATSASFLATATVKLTPTPAKHVAFTEWLGDCSGSGPCELSMGEDHQVEAKFTEVPKEPLALVKTGGGTGTVKSDPSGINCGATCSSSTAAYYQGDLVTLTATPAKGSSFGGWSAGGCSGTGPCEVTIAEAEEVQAEFR